MKYDGYQHRLGLMVYQFFNMKTYGSGTKNENISHKELAEWYKPIITKCKKRKVHSPFIDNIWGTDLADMQLINLIKDLNFYCAILTFLANPHGLFL